MKTFDYEVKETLGLHARPAQQLSVFAKSCRSSIRISNANGQADLRDIITAMLLDVTQGQTVRFEVEGIDEDTAAEKLREHVERLL
ncbi:MAG: HPr family phosphocarrier protein [Dorea sp.]|nr:HPr family phosphocarrier protein [Dorea sp.]